MNKIANILRAPNLFLYLDQIQVSGANFLMQALLARLIGIELFGIYVIVYLIIQLVQGMHLAIVIKPLYSLGPKSQCQSAFAFANRSLHFLLSIVAGLGIYLFFWMTSFQSEYVTPEVVGFFTVVFLNQDFWRKTLLYQKKYKWAFGMDTIHYLLPLVSFFLLQIDGLSSLFWLLSFCAIASTTVGVYASKPTYQLKAWAEIKKPLLEQLEFGKWLFATAICQWMTSNYFVLAAGLLLTPAAAGAIRIIQTLLGLVHILFLVVENSLPVRAAELLTTSGMESCLRFFRNYSQKHLLIVIGILTVMVVSAPLTIQLFFGPEYINWSEYVLPFSFIYLFSFTALLLRILLRTASITFPIFLGYAITSCFSFLCANAFIGWWGISGVIAGLLLSQIILIFNYIIFIKNKSWKSYISY